MMRLFYALLFTMLSFLPMQGGFIAPAVAITAEEQLADPELEARARGLSRQLRCLVCQNQSIDDSDADLAKDLRAEVRKQLLGGADDAAILADLKQRYGDYVLLKPPVNLATTLLWATPVLALLLGAGLILATRRKIAAAQSRNTAQISSRHHLAETVTANITGAPSDADSKTSRHSNMILLIAGGVCVAGAAVLYWFVLGAPSMPAQPLSARTAELNQTSALAKSQLEEKQQAFATAREKTLAQPENIGGWLDLALASAELGRAGEELMPCVLPVPMGISALNPCLPKPLPVLQIIRSFQKPASWSQKYCKTIQKSRVPCSCPALPLWKMAIIRRP